MTDHALPARGRRVHRSVGRRVLLTALLLVAVAFTGAPIAYMLWPRPQPLSVDAPTLPINVGGVAFNIPPAAIRVKMQRRAGTQARIDLVFLWPSLLPPDPAAKPSASNMPKLAERIFVTIAGNDNTLPPEERLKSIYPRYVTSGPGVDMNGLTVRAFNSGTPYQGEDLIYDAKAPERLLMRCTNSFGVTPGTCLHERRLGGADITMRFPREWLSDWRGVASGIDRLIAGLRASGS